MMKMSLQARRDVIGRLEMDLVRKSGPLTEKERVKLNALRREADRIEEDIATDFEHRAYQALEQMIRRGVAGCTEENKKILKERRDMLEAGLGTGAATGGGVLVPVQFNDKVTAAMKFAGPMIDDDVCTILTTQTGGSRAFPSDNDSSVTGQLVSEGSQVSGIDIGGLSQVVLKTYKVGSAIKASAELADDALYPFVDYVASRLGVRQGRILNQLMTNGSGGGSQPTGFITAATVAGTAVGAGGNDGTSGANSLGTVDFATLESAVDPLYRKGARWMTHPNTLSKLRAQVDKQGHPLYPGLQNSPDGIDRIFNYGVLVNPQMDQLQANASSPTVTRKVLAFGDWSYYQIRRTPSTLVRLSERFIDFGEICYILWSRYDGNLLDGGGGAIKVLQTVY